MPTSACNTGTGGHQIYTKLWITHRSPRLVRSLFQANWPGSRVPWAFPATFCQKADSRRLQATFRRNPCRMQLSERRACKRPFYMDCEAC